MAIPIRRTPGRRTFCWQDPGSSSIPPRLEHQTLVREFSDGYTFRSDDDGEEKKPGFLARRKARREAKKAEQTRLRTEAHERAVEEVLRKVSASGIDTLTPSERRILEEETRRQRLG